MVHEPEEIDLHFWFAYKPHLREVLWNSRKINFYKRPANKFAATFTKPACAG